MKEENRYQRPSKHLEGAGGGVEAGQGMAVCLRCAMCGAETCCALTCGAEMIRDHAVACAAEIGCVCCVQEKQAAEDVAWQEKLQVLR
eukprot:760341-Rhodomonas_salina.2